jgi:ABC-2 type transport system permease protein
MRSLYAVFKREIKAYFTQPMAYVMMGGFLLTVGFWYWLRFQIFLFQSFDAMRHAMSAEELDLGHMVVSSTIGTTGAVSTFTLPLLTMRMWAEEKRSGTVELLLTLPLRDCEIVLGKFFAALAVYSVLLLLTLLYPMIAAAFGSLDVGPVFSGYFGTFLLGATLLALGFLCSTWTESQLTACAFAWAAFLLFFWLISLPADFVGKLGPLLTHLSFAIHYENLVKGVIEIQDVAYFVLFTLFCLFLTLRSLELTRWRG